MNIHRKKNSIFIFVLIISVAMVIIVKIRFFLTDKSQDTNNDFFQLWEETKKVGGSFGESYDEFRGNFSRFGKTLQEKKEIYDPKIFEEFRQSLLLEANKKNLERLDPEIHDLKNVFLKNYTLEFSTISQGALKDMAAEAKIFLNKPCVVCHGSSCTVFENIRPRKILEFYKKEGQKKIKLLMIEYNLGLMDGMCHKQLLFETSKFIVVDSCKNDIACEDVKEMDEILRGYFQNSTTSFHGLNLLTP